MDKTEMISKRSPFSQNVNNCGHDALCPCRDQEEEEGAQKEFTKEIY